MSVVSLWDSYFVEWKIGSIGSLVSFDPFVVNTLNRCDHGSESREIHFRIRVNKLGK
jgi:hypothetical protein